MEEKNIHQNDQKFHVGIKALIVNENNQILLLRASPEELKGDTPSHWDIPGGRIKGNDSIEETLYREVEEELGVKNIEILKLFDVLISNLKVPLKNEIVGLLLIVYKCELPDNNEKFNLSFEHLEYKWTDVEETKELLKVKYPKSFLERLNSLKK